jgi:hypothetical protein
MRSVRLKFNPDDPQSVQEAIRQMEAAVDSKTAAYRGNALVSKLAEGLKGKYREKILERANRSQRAEAMTLAIFSLYYGTITGRKAIPIPEIARNTATTLHLHDGYARRGHPHL